MPAPFVKLDLVDRLAPRVSQGPAQLIVALACVSLAVLTRASLDLFAPGAGPFALTFPFVLFATLFARWGAGVLVMSISALYAWYFVLPVTGSFEFENATDGPRVAVNLLSGFLIVSLAEYFRRVVRNALRERDAIAEELRLLLAEVDHRVKNNFAMVSAMIRLEARSASGDVSDALQVIRGRVDSIARAHEALYRDENGGSEVALRPYLGKLCASLDDAYFEGRHTITHDVDDLSLPRDRAIAVGLVINELCTNAAKHAFPDRQDGQIKVRLRATSDGIGVTIEDNGVGFPDAPTRDGSLGQGLIHAFAEQASGRLERVEVSAGTKFQLSLPTT